MIVEKLSTELERLYDQEELEALSRDLLGFEPPNGDSGKSAIARALAQRCVEQDAVAALLDAVAVSRQKRLVPRREWGRSRLVVAMRGCYRIFRGVRL